MKRIEPDTTVIVYILAGIPDITERMVRAAHYTNFEWVPKYEEVLFTQSVASACTQFMDKVWDASDRIYEAGGVPVFCTVSPMSLKTWNRNRLGWGVTSCLLHEDKYNLQQENLDEAIMHINKSIQNVNRFNGVDTPRLAQEII